MHGAVLISIVFTAAGSLKIFAFNFYAMIL